MKHVQALCEFFGEVKNRFFRYNTSADMNKFLDEFNPLACDEDIWIPVIPTLRERCVLDEQGRVKKFDNFVQEDPNHRPSFVDGPYDKQLNI